jgi:hypothetical protein
MSAASGSCGDHSRLSADLRAFALSVLDRLDPLLARLRTEPSSRIPEMCASCPVCALLAAVRGEHPELAGRLATHAAGVLSVLRAALEEGVPRAGGTQEPGPEPDAPERRVQHILIDREQVAG